MPEGRVALLYPREPGGEPNYTGRGPHRANGGGPFSSPGRAPCPARRQGHPESSGGEVSGPRDHRGAHRDPARSGLRPTNGRRWITKLRENQQRTRSSCDLTLVTNGRRCVDPGARIRTRSPTSSRNGCATSHGGPEQEAAQVNRVNATRDSSRVRMERHRMAAPFDRRSLCEHNLLCRRSPRTRESSIAKPAESAEREWMA